MHLKPVLSFFAVLLVGLPALALNPPRELTLGLSEPGARSLGGVCFSTDLGEQALPCNPAFTARETRDDFKAQFFFGDNISYLDDVSRLLAGEGDQQTFQRLFSQTRASEMEANIEAAYRRPTFGIALAPSRLVYYSAWRNRALPWVTLLAAQERSLRVQFAGYAGHDLSWGLQARGVNRRFISQEFTLADALAESGKELLQVQTQNALYLEPGLLKEFPDAPWRPQATMTLRNLGLVDKKSEVFSAGPELHVGGALHPDFELGRLEIGVDAVLHSQTQAWSDPLRLGLSYELGVTRFSGSVARSEQSVGFELLYKNLNGGLTTSSRWIENFLGEPEWVRTIYVHFGFDL